MALGRPGPPCPVVGARPLDERLIGQRRDAGRLRRARDVERHAQPVQHVGDGRRAVGPAEPGAAQAVDLREGAGDDDVAGLVDQLDAGVVVVGVDVLGVGGVDHQQHARRQALAQAPHLVAGR